MTDFPLLMSAPMVRAMLREIEAPGTGKTQTRRLAWRRHRLKSMGGSLPTDVILGNNGTLLRPTVWQKAKPGDLCWIRETWAGYIEKVPGVRGGCPWVFYRATDEDDFYPGMKWKPSIHMPRRFSRITFELTEVRIERLQDISHEDAVAEGMGIFPHSMSAQKRFRQVWGDIHGPDAWDANPEVVVLVGYPRLVNIDVFKRAA